MLHRGREFNLGALCRIAQPLEGHFVPFAAQVQAFVLLEFINQPIDDALVKVVTTQVSVTVGSLDFDNTFAYFQNRNIKRAAAEVVDRDGFVLAFVETVGQRGSRWLVDDSLYLEPGDLSGILGSLPLRVVEVGRHGDDRLIHLFAQIVLCRLFQLLQDHGGNLRRRVLLALRQNGYVIARLDHLVRHHLDFF